MKAILFLVLLFAAITPAMADHNQKAGGKGYWAEAQPTPLANYRSDLAVAAESAGLLQSPAYIAQMNVLADAIAGSPIDPGLMVYCRTGTAAGTLQTSALVAASKLQAMISAAGGNIATFTPVVEGVQQHGAVLNAVQKLWPELLSTPTATLEAAGISAQVQALQAMRQNAESWPLDPTTETHWSVTHVVANQITFLAATRDRFVMQRNLQLQQQAFTMLALLALAIGTILALSWAAKRFRRSAEAIPAQAAVAA